MKNKIEILSDGEHVLKRPSMYIGAIDETEVSDFVIADESITYQTVKYIPGLIKIIDEIIANAIDESIRHDFKVATTIKVYVEDNKVSVEDDGNGIPIIKEAKTDQWMPVCAWGMAKAGANFNNDESRTTIGLNGVGSFATNVFSTKFIGETCDRSKKLRVTFKKNATELNIDVENSKEASYTKVTFWPDLARFRLAKIDEIHKNLIKQKLVNFAIAYPQITFKFNGKVINVRSGKRFLEMFGKPYEHFENENLLVGIMPNEQDDFKFYSYVNGLKMANGGNHIDRIMNEIINGVRAKLKKVDLKPGDIKNKMLLVCLFKNFPNAKFDSQTKERLTNSVSEINEFITSIDFDKLSKQISKNDEIITPIVEMFQLKEELKNRQMMTKLGKAKKKIRCDKYLPPTRNQKYFVIAEGASATSSLMPILGREDFGYFSCRGVPLNAYEVNTRKIYENEELNNIIQILELQLEDKAHGSDICTYQNILLAQDADLDGSKIKGLMLGFFSKYFPHLFKEHKIKTLKTPIIVLKKNNKVCHWFFTFDEYNTFKAKNDLSKYSLDYKKGLGSWKADELRAIIKDNSIEKFIEDLDLDTGSEKYINDWLSKETSDIRKTMLLANTFSIFSI